MMLPFFSSKGNNDDKITLKAIHLKSRKTIKSDLSKNTFHNALPSYQYPLEQFVTTPESTPEVILKQILMERTREKSTTQELPLQKIYHTGYSAACDKDDDIEKWQIFNANANENTPVVDNLSITTFLYTNLTLNMKQTPIRSVLSHKEREEEDDYDLFEEECQPDWVTSSFRLGSICRRRNEKNVAMQRIQKEIELEKQRDSDMIKMKQNDKRTLC